MTASSSVLVLTLIAASLRLGFSTNAVEALAGTLSVPVLYDGVRRAAGRPAALAAAAALALMPEALLASGSADAVMTLLVVVALWLSVAAAGRHGPGRGVPAGVALGLACAIRPAQAAVCIPALLVVHAGGAGRAPHVARGGRARPGSRRSRSALAELALAVLAGGVVGGLAYLLIGGATGSAGAGLATGGLLGLVSAGGLQYDSVFGDVLVATLAVAVAAVAASVIDRRGALPGSGARRNGGRRTLAVATGVWIASGLVAFAATGLVDGRDLEATAPALAIGLGLGTARLAGFGQPAAVGRRPATLALALALAGICAYAFHFGETAISWGTFALLEAAVGAALLTAAPGWPCRLGRWGVGAIVVACSLAVPVHATLALVRAGWARSIGIAGIAPAGLSDPASSRAAGGPPATGGALPIGPITSVAVSATALGAPMPRGFLGFSFEYPALLSYAGTDPAAVNPVLLALVRGLNPAGSPVLRIGGDSTDHTWWPVPGMHPPGGVNVELTSDWLRVARAVADDLGGRLILGVNLAADDPALAAAEARALLDGIGRRDIEALEIGNEADVYTEFPWYRGRDGHVHFARHPGYELADFIDDFDRWRSMMPRAPLAGPAFAHLQWMAGLQRFLSTAQGLRLVTFHRYPTRACRSNSSDAAYASIANLMARDASSGLAAQVSPFVAAAHRAGLPFRLDELNSASCAGKLGVSNTFAASLWVLDTLFNLAAVGVDGVNVHTLPGAAYAPFAFSHQNGQWSGQVRPLYYGLLLFARAFPAGARLLSVHSPSSDIRAWATEGPGGRFHVVLINDNPSGPITVRLQLPGPPAPMAATALRAPSLDATTGITLGGESFGASTTTGVLPQNPHPERISPVLGSYLVTLPAASAVMLSR